MGIHESVFLPLVGRPIAVGGKVDGHSFIGMLTGCADGVLTIEEADGDVWLVDSWEVVKVGSGPTVSALHNRGLERAAAKREHDATCPTCNPPPPTPALSPEELANIERCGSLAERLEDDGR